jgi:polyisoprenoid-binding protein YceI
MKTLFQSGFALAALLLIDLAQAERYVIDPVHSRVLIRVSHAGFAQAMATLSAPRGHIDYDPDLPEQARVEVELPLDRLDFGDADWNRRMARRDYFDSEQHPIARFVSTSVQAGADGELRIAGELELRGTRAPVELRARVNRLGRDLPFIPRHSLGASATALLDRRDFGMDRHASVVGDAVEVWIEVEARRQRRGGSPDTSTRGIAPADDTEETRESAQPSNHDRSSTPSDDKDTRDATAKH